jgi:hypothetical protein
LEYLEDVSNVPQVASSRAICRRPNDVDAIALSHGRKDQVRDLSVRGTGEISEIVGGVGAGTDPDL